MIKSIKLNEKNIRDVFQNTLRHNICTINESVIGTSLNTKTKDLINLKIVRNALLEIVT